MRAHRVITSLVGIACGAAMAIPFSSLHIRADASALRQFTSQQWLATGGPIFPPPSDPLPLLPRFIVLHQSYVALDGPAKLPFTAWVIANGVTDPRMVEAFALLYAWYQRATVERGGR